MKLKIMVLALLVVILFSPAIGQSLEIVGDRVIEDDARATIQQWPHTFSYGDQKVSLSFKTKTYSGPVNIVFGFDSDIATPRSLEYYNGDHWVDIADHFTRVDEEHYNMDRWYYTTDVEFTAGTEYVTRLGVNFKQPGSGKYWVCMYPSTDTIQSAIDNGRYMCLDPWWDITFLHRTVLTGNLTINTANVTIPGYVNVTLNGSQETMTCPLMIPTTPGVMGYVYWNDHTDYVCVNNTDTDQEYSIIDEGNGTKNGNLPLDVVALYDMGSGNCNATQCDDSSIYNGILTKVGSGEPALNSSGKLGHAQWFDGTNDKMTYDNDAFWNSAYADGNDFYMAGWYYVEPPSLGAPSNYNYLFDRTGHFSGGFDASNQPFLYFWRGGSDRCLIQNTGNAITLNTWYYIEFYASGSSCSGAIYINLVNESTAYTPSSNAKVTTNPFLFGFSGGTVYYNGMADRVMFLNVTPSDDERRAMYYSMVGTFNYTENETYMDLDFNIDDPTTGDNFTYPDSVTVNWSQVYGVCNQTWYSLNSGSNVTTDCLNFTLTSADLSFGGNSLTMWMNDSNSTEVSQSVSFTYYYLQHNISIRDEITGEPYNFTNQTVVTAEMYCENKTINYTLTGPELTGIQTDCVVIESRLTIVEAGETMWRSLIPDPGETDLIFYMTNTSEHDVNSLSLYITDLTNQWIPGIIQIRKNVINYTDQGILDQNIDAENKIIFYWIVGEKYELYIVSGDNVKYLGELIADTSTSKSITVSDVSLIPENTIWSYLRWRFVDTTSHLQLQYYDGSGGTTLLTMTVYNVSNSSEPIIYSVTSTLDEVTLEYAKPNNSTRYKVCMNSLRVNNLDYEECRIFTSGSLTVAIMDENPVWYAVIGVFIAVIIVALTSGRNVKYGLAGAMLWLNFINAVGWFDSLSVSRWILQPLWASMFILAFIWAMTESEKQ